MGVAFRCECCGLANLELTEMATGQLWLLEPPRPLVERFGAEFFRSLPTNPGVYLMCGDTEGVLYVGKARNLRKRLTTYRVANPERFPRRVIRLLFQVRRIEWDVCTTESAATEREAALICVLNPKFNRAGKVWPVVPTAARRAPAGNGKFPRARTLTIAKRNTESTCPPPTETWFHPG